MLFEFQKNHIFIKYVSSYRLTALHHSCWLDWKNKFGYFLSFKLRPNQKVFVHFASQYDLETSGTYNTGCLIILLNLVDFMLILQYDGPIALAE